MTHTFTYSVHIFDTDCYGVAWHGSYTKWLEMGRVNLFQQAGISMKEFSETSNIVFPVTEQHVRYKSSAHLEETLCLSTSLMLSEPKAIFNQVLIEQDTQRLVIEAMTTIVLTNRAGKLYRRFPEVFIAACNNWV
jgi:acyl-CoA thioester hydrolase